MSKPWGFIDKSGWYLISGICGETINDSVQNYIVVEKYGGHFVQVKQAWCLKPNSDGQELPDLTFNDLDHSGPAPGFLTVNHWKRIDPDKILTKNLGIWAEIDSSFAEVEEEVTFTSSILGDSNVIISRFDRINKRFTPIINNLKTDSNTGKIKFKHRTIPYELYSFKGSGGRNAVNGILQACDIMTLRISNATGYLGEIHVSPATTIAYKDIEDEINNGIITDISIISKKMIESRINLKNRLNLTNPDIIDTGHLYETNPDSKGDIAKILIFNSQMIKGIRIATNILNLADNSLKKSIDDNNDIMNGIRSLFKQSNIPFNFNENTINDILKTSISIKGNRLDQIINSLSSTIEERENALTAINSLRSNWGLPQSLTEATSFSNLESQYTNTIDNIKNLWSGVSAIIENKINYLTQINVNLTPVLTQMAQIEIAVEGLTSYDAAGNIIGELNPIVEIDDNSGTNVLIESISGDLHDILLEASNNNLATIDNSNATPRQEDSLYTKLWLHINNEAITKGHPGLIRLASSETTSDLKNPSTMDKFNIAIHPLDVAEHINSILNPQDRHYAFVYADISGLKEYLYNTARTDTPAKLNGVNLDDYFYGPIWSPDSDELHTSFNIRDLSNDEIYNISLVDVSATLTKIKKTSHNRNRFRNMGLRNRIDINKFSLYLVANIDIQDPQGSRPIQYAGTSILFHLYTRGVGHTGDTIHDNWHGVGEESVHFQKSYVYRPHIDGNRVGNENYVYWLIFPDINFSGPDLRVDGTFDEDTHLLSLSFKNVGDQNSTGDSSHNQYATIIELTRDYRDASGLGFLLDTSAHYINVVKSDDSGQPSQIKYYPKARLNISRDDLSNSIIDYDSDISDRTLYIDSNELINQHIENYGVHFGWQNLALMRETRTGSIIDDDIVTITIDFSNSQALKYGSTYGVFFDVPNMYNQFPNDLKKYKGWTQNETNDLYDFPMTNNVFVFTVGPEPPEPGEETFTLELDESDFTLNVYLKQSITDSSGIGSIQLDISGINGISLEDISIGSAFNYNYESNLIGIENLSLELDGTEIKILQPAYYVSDMFQGVIYADVSNGGRAYMIPITNTGLLLKIDATKIADNTKLEFNKSNCKITKFNNDITDGSNSRFRDISNVFDNYRITYGVAVDKTPFFTDSSLIQVFASKKQVYLVLPSIDNLHNDLRYFYGGIQGVVCLAFNNLVSDFSLNDYNNMEHGEADAADGEERLMNQACLNTKLKDGDYNNILPAHDNRQAIYPYFKDGYNDIPRVTGLYMKSMFLNTDGPDEQSYVVSHSEVFGTVERGFMSVNLAEYVNINNT